MPELKRIISNVRAFRRADGCSYKRIYGQTDPTNRNTFPLKMI